jgi:chromosome segregation ATPase
MNLMGMLKRGDKLDKAFEELQTDMLDVLDEDLFSLADAPIGVEVAGGPAETAPAPAAVEKAPEPTTRMTPHAQSRMAALESLEDLHRGAQDHLEVVGTALSEIFTAHHMTREFLNAVHSDIHRASELETANVAFAAENRKLAEQLHDTQKKIQEREAALEALQRRETTLLQDRDALRVELASARLENVEVGNSLARSESDRNDLVKTLSMRTIEAERRLRENEVLREKQVNLSIDLEKSLKREAETRRKLDEISSAHANETTRHRETQATLSKADKEVIRLQKQVEIAEAKQSELSDAAIGREAESDAESKRSLAEIRGLKDEIQSLNARLEKATNERVDAADEISRLKAQLDDAASERQVSQEMLAALKRESDSDKKELAAAQAGLSQLSLSQASDEIGAGADAAEKLRAEVDALKAAMDSLKAENKHLRPYERLYREAKAKLQPVNGTDAEGTVTSRKQPADGNRKH